MAMWGAKYLEIEKVFFLIQTLMVKNINTENGMFTLENLEKIGEQRG
jgi:hypothetical protein